MVLSNNILDTVAAVDKHHGCDATTWDQLSYQVGRYVNGDDPPHFPVPAIQRWISLAEYLMSRN